MELFVEEVRRFRAFCAGALEVALPERLVQARARLLALYVAALELPRDAAGDVNARDVEPVPVYSFDEQDAYWEVFNPYVEDEPVRASLSDDLGDIYADVSRGLILWDAGHRADAIWEWRFHFDTHWGAHAIDALRALHYAISRLETGSSG